MTNGPASNATWLYDSPVHSDVETKLRSFLVELGNADKILGIQVCAFKDGEVIIDTAAGVLDKDDPRPVQPDSLFPVFSTTKGITAGMVHWLADKGKLKLDDYVANIWPAFGTNGKDKIKVNHILNHSSGLHNALAGICEDPTLLCDYDECLKRIAMAAPETEPGREQLYHYLSYGWLCGGIIEHASGKKFQDVLEEAFVRPLNIEGEFYIGIPTVLFSLKQNHPNTIISFWESMANMFNNIPGSSSGVESRLATLTNIDTDELIIFRKLLESDTIPSSFTIDVITSIITLSNTLNVRRAIVPAGNGHISARALARYYAALALGGVVPPLEKKADHSINTEIFTNSKEKIHDAFLGRGDYKDLIIPNGISGLGFRRVNTTNGSLIGFGHAGLGGSTGYCDINNRFAISVTLNKLSLGALTGEIIRFVCSELDLPIPEDYAGIGKDMWTDKPKIN